MLRPELWTFFQQKNKKSISSILLPWWITICSLINNWRCTLETSTQLNKNTQMNWKKGTVSVQSWRGKPTNTCFVQRNLLIKGLQPTDKSISGTCKIKSSQSQSRNLMQVFFSLGWLVLCVFFFPKAGDEAVNNSARQSQNYWNK